MNVSINFARLSRIDQPRKCGTGRDGQPRWATNFSVAEPIPRKKDEVMYHECVMYSSTKQLQWQWKELYKGNQVSLVGHMTQDVWVDKQTGKNRRADKVEVDDIHFFGRRDGQVPDMPWAKASEPTIAYQVSVPAPAPTQAPMPWEAAPTAQPAPAPVQDGPMPWAPDVDEELPVW